MMDFPRKPEPEAIAALKKGFEVQDITKRKYTFARPTIEKDL
jgi:hypothetical protein